VLARTKKDFPEVLEPQSRDEIFRQKVRNGHGGFRATKAYDLLAAAPLVIFYLFALGGLKLQFDKEIPGFVSGRWDATLLFNFLLNIVTAIYMLMTIWIVTIRKMPVAKSQGVGPRLIALIGANLQMSLLALPHAAVAFPVSVVSLVLATLGTGAEIGILAWLRHSFSIFPEARKLVTGGPYHWIRHPIYLAGTVSSLGLCLQFEQPWAFLITLVTFAFQLGRIQYEEAVLTRAFPDYADYARTTARLVPGIY
jgi:protein-S-isoprenylcysteine O-methyltransferase Ste14